MRFFAAALAVVWMISVGVAGAPQEKGSNPQVDPALVDALMQEGSALFGSDCAACHAAEGGESIGPAMTNNAALASKEHVIRRILEGSPAKGMPPFAATYTDRKVAAAATFIRGSFDNAYPPVVERDVARVREDVKNGSSPKGP